MAKEIDGLKKRLDDTKMTTKRFEEIRRQDLMYTQRLEAEVDRLKKKLGFSRAL